MSTFVPTRTTLLRSQSHAFCQAFLTGLSPSTTLDRFFIATDPHITEHGPAWARSRLPFLGKTFAGREACEEYFEILTKVLEFLPSKDTFPGPKGMVVDAEAEDGKGVVHVKARGKFKAKATGREWEEEFAYRLSGFDKEGRIGHWEIWADPLSAWAAVGNEELS
ncbi:MAG: hypothetical protein M1821_008557 [Bathelium mastoideum]|nr:MAG: hypothetical protein M1821_008557 [Bathelium mastoideum]